MASTVSTHCAIKDEWLSWGWSSRMWYHVSVNCWAVYC